ncbi:MAG: class I SAM-dependent methyltransferase [Candidatus Woesearchaeota archaeon]|nr:class I SAM-dependent methyltransferase [Candidatus Woesearchaeota archaeon]
MECLVCGRTDFKTLLNFEKAPKDIQGLLKHEDLENDTFISFDLIQCTHCDMVQLSDFDNIAEDYYDDYIMAQTFSEHSRAYSKRLAEEFVQKYNLQGKSLFEVGCGDGEFLKYLKDAGMDTLGIEPSAPFAKLAEEKGLTIRIEYFGDETPLQPDTHDAFASRAVFEHLKNPHEVLRNVKKVLKEGGIGIIEVPSFEKAIKDNRYYDIFSDHVAYYTKRTMMKLLEEAGFEILEAYNEFEEEYIVVVFRKNSAYHLQHFVDDAQTYKDTFRTTLDTLKGKNIVLWGAGGKGNALLSLCNIGKDDITYVVDADPHKKGRFTIGHHFEIKHPDVIKEDKPDVVIISAMAFKDEILQMLRDYNYRGKIYLIAPTLHEVQL